MATQHRCHRHVHFLADEVATRVNRVILFSMKWITISKILVNVNALNPTDWKHISYELASANSISGCDYAGIVVEIGADVSKGFSPGDRICGCAHGANFDEPSDGVFAQYAMVKGDLQMKIPEFLSFEKAATLPLGVASVGQGLYQKALKLNLPTNPTKNGEWVLIYGGSSATGSLGVQFAKLYVHFPLIASLGSNQLQIWLQGGLHRLPRKPLLRQVFRR